MTPAFVFVPGAFHTPFHFSPIVSELRTQGYQAETVAFPTIGPRAQQYGLKDEIEAVRDGVAEIIDSQHKDIILVCHSYGGWPASRAITGWDKSTREKSGRRNGILQLFFINAFLVPEGISLSTLFQGAVPDWVTNQVSSDVEGKQACRKQ